MLPWWRKPSDAVTRAGGFIPELESLRGVAITLVFLLHVDAWVGFHQPTTARIEVSALRAFVLGGHTGVSLFFILSGFLLGRPFLLEGLGGKRLGRAAYFARRALRILPLYTVAVIVGAIACARQPTDLLHGVPYLFFLNSFSGMATPLEPYSNQWWSLATEAQFYLLLPLIPFFLRSRAGRGLGLVAVFAYGIAYRAFILGSFHAHTLEGQIRLSHSLFGRAPLFAFGVLAAWVCERFGGRIQSWAATSPWVRFGAGDLVLLLLLWCLGELLRLVVFTSYWQSEMGWHYWHIAEGMLWTAVMLLVLLVPLWTRVLVCNGVWKFLGRVSYSIYLINGGLIPFALAMVSRVSPGAVMGWHLRTFAVVGVVAVLCVGLSSLTYWAIERPFLRRKGRLAWWSSAAPSRRPTPEATPGLVTSRLG